jgi:hypothetical protein
MTAVLMIAGAFAALGMGIWIGVGAPGWPKKSRPTDLKTFRKRLKKRSVNPIDAYRVGPPRRRR